MPVLAAVLYGLISAVSWGIGDFSGGLASRRSSTFSVVLLGYILGGALLWSCALLFGEPFPQAIDLVYGWLGGFSGLIGLLALYHGIAHGRTSVVAPVSAVAGATAPVLVSSWLEGLPGPAAAVGILMGILGVWFVSRAETGQRLASRDLRLGTLAGLGFSGFFIFLDRVSAGIIFWPLVFARWSLVPLIWLAARLWAQSPLPRRHALLPISLAAAFDAGGNVFFVLAAQTGRLDIAAVLSSLYTAVTVLLSAIILGERITAIQWAGVAAAIGAVILFTV